MFVLMMQYLAVCLAPISITLQIHNTTRKESELATPESKNQLFHHQNFH